MLSSTVVRDAVPPYIYKGGTTHFPCYSREWERHGNNRNNRTPALIWSCSRPCEQDSQKHPLFEAPEKGCYSRLWEQQKWPRKALSHRHPGDPSMLCPDRARPADVISDGRGCPYGEIQRAGGDLCHTCATVLAATPGTFRHNSTIISNLRKYGGIHA
jgi:hypothetical protein